MGKRILSRKRVAFGISLPVFFLALLLVPPYPVFSFVGFRPIGLLLAVVLAKALAAFLIDVIFVHARTYFRFLRSIWTSRGLLLRLAANDFRKKYATSYLGSLWGFIMPLIQIVTFWFVFEVGFRSGAVGECPYILWLIAGIVPWFFIADSILSGSTVFLEYSYLVKKMVFRIELLPFVKVVAAFFVHVFFLVVVLVVFMLQGYGLSWYALQLIYYLFCLFSLLFSLSLLFAILNVFIRDVAQAVAVLIQIGFWVTPIGWVFEQTVKSPVLQVIFKLNPFFYLVEGYRQSLVTRVGFWTTPLLTVYFWLFVLLTFLLGIRLFDRLKTHFADLL